jgi:integrase
MKFSLHGQLIRESTGSQNKRLAAQVEAGRRAQLLRGEVGIREKVKAPTLEVFALGEFATYIEGRCKDKPKTARYYSFGVRHLCEYRALAQQKLDEITIEMVVAYAGKLRDQGYEITTVNRILQVLRRILRLAADWGRIEKQPPRITMQPGERRRDRVLTYSEEERYLAAAAQIGREIEQAHQRALNGIRCIQRGEQPQPLRDPYLLLHVATLLLDTGMRPEEAYRLEWVNVRDGMVSVGFGKTANAARVIPLPERSAAMISMRRNAALSERWVFPAATRSGHIDHSTLKKRHARACKMAGLEHLHVYAFRHTVLTRWSQHLDPYSLAKLAGHADFATTRKYVHVGLDRVVEAMEKVAKARAGHKNGHTTPRATEHIETPTRAIN